MSQEDRARRLGSFMTKCLGLNLARSRINETNLFVLARRHQLGAVPVEAGAKDDVGMAVHVQEHFTSADIPDDDLIVGASREQHIQGRRVPQNETNATLMVQ